MLVLSVQYVVNNATNDNDTNDSDMYCSIVVTQVAQRDTETHTAIEEIEIKNMELQLQKKLFEQVSGEKIFSTFFKFCRCC